MATIMQQTAECRQMVQEFSDKSLLAFYASCVRARAKNKGFWEKFFVDISEEEVLRRMSND